MYACPYRSTNELNCSQQIIKYAEAYLGKPWTADVYEAHAAFHSGLGIGSTCCGLLGALSVLGMLYDEDTARQKGLILMDQFQAMYGTLLCPKLQHMTQDDCESILQNIFRILKPLLPEPSDEK